MLFIKLKNNYKFYDDINYMIGLKYRHRVKGVLIDIATKTH